MKKYQRKTGVIYGNYHQMVEAKLCLQDLEILLKNQKLWFQQETEVVFNLQDVCIRLKGHKIQIQVQSTTSFVCSKSSKILENPYKAENRLYQSFPKIFNNSVIEVEVLK